MNTCARDTVWTARFCLVGKRGPAVAGWPDEPNIVVCRDGPTQFVTDVYVAEDDLYAHALRRIVQTLAPPKHARIVLSFSWWKDTPDARAATLFLANKLLLNARAAEVRFYAPSPTLADGLDVLAALPRTVRCVEFAAVCGPDFKIPDRVWISRPLLQHVDIVCVERDLALIDTIRIARDGTQKTLE